MDRAIKGRFFNGFFGDGNIKQRGKELIHLTAFSIDQSSSLSKKTKRRLTRYRNKMELRRFNNK
jgi:ribosomal protein S2